MLFLVNPIYRAKKCIYVTHSIEPVGYHSGVLHSDMPLILLGLWQFALWGIRRGFTDNYTR